MVDGAVVTGLRLWIAFIVVLEATAIVWHNVLGIIAIVHGDWLWLFNLVRALFYYFSFFAILIALREVHRLHTKRRSSTARDAYAWTAYLVVVLPWQAYLFLLIIKEGQSPDTTVALFGFFMGINALTALWFVVFSAVTFIYEL